MAKTTWDANRTGGGTYEFSQDAEGKYKLNSIGFQKFGKLNLPDLGESKATILPVDTEKASKQTKQAFGDVKPFYYDQKGGGADSNEQYINEYKIQKDKSLGTEPEPAGAWDRGQWGPRPGDTGQPTTGDGPWTMRTGKADQYTPIDLTKAKKDAGTFLSKIDDKTTAESGMQFIDPTVTKADKAQVDKFGPGQWGPKPSKGMPITPSDRQPGFEIANKRVSPQKAKVSETALKHVRTASDVLSKAVGFVMDHSIIGKIAHGLVSPEQRQLNERNSSALSSLGYKTRGELGSSRDPGRIAGNPADNVFAGMNAESTRGNVFNGARNRVTTRNSAKTQARISKLSPERQKAFNDKTKEFEGQIQAAQGEKNQQDIDKGPGHYGPAGGGGNGGGGGGKSIICTQMYQQTQLEDWKKTMQLWYIFQKKYLTIEHQKGYHFLFKPFVSGMKKSKILTAIGKHCAIARTNDIKHIMFGTPFSLLGRLVRLVTEPVCYITGKIKSWL